MGLKMGCSNTIIYGGLPDLITTLCEKKDQGEKVLKSLILSVHTDVAQLHSMGIALILITINNITRRTCEIAKRVIKNGKGNQILLRQMRRRNT